MSSGIYLIQNDGQLLEMTEQPYSSEDLLQELLAKYPNLLAGDQIDNSAPRRWLLISREHGLPSEEEGGDRWSLDHLFLDQDAVPTLVEVKRSNDSRIRREVVGQMLDYAANAVAYLPVEKMRARFEATCKGVDPGEVITRFLGKEVAPDDFWQKVKTNLQAGRIRLLFVADEIPAELRRIIEFLNGQMDPAEVLAVEIKQFIGQGAKALVPRVIGQTLEAERKKTGGTRKEKDWDETSVLQDMEALQGSEAAATTRRILEWAKTRRLRLAFGRGFKRGSVYPVLDFKAQEHRPFGLLCNGSVEVWFKQMGTRPPFDNESKRREFLRRLNEIPGVNLPEDACNRYPSISLALLKDEAPLKQFLQAADWFIEEVKAS